MDFLNLTLPCGDSCPLRLATAKKCFFHSDMKDLYLTFDVPKIDADLQLVEADPFKLMLQTENKTCQVKYIGPQNAIVSNKEGCTYAVNLKSQATHDLILSPSSGCEPGSHDTNNRHFGIERCDPRREHDERGFIQIKPHHGSNLIYCPKSFITFDGKTAPCPEDVFILPIVASFKINNVEFQGSQVHLDHVQTVDPLFTTRTNWHLQPRANFTALRQDPLVLPEMTQDLASDLIWHPMTWTTISCLLIILILVCVVFGLYRYFRRSIQISVTSTPATVPAAEPQD